MTEQKSIKNVLTQGRFWGALFGSLVCILLLVIALGMAQRQRRKAQVLGVTEILHEPGELTETINPPEWKRVSASSEADLAGGDYLIFTLAGEQVPEIGNEDEYYVVERSAYENFTPKTIDDLILLQLPEKTLRPLTTNSAFVELAAPWKVPAEVTGELVYQVDSWNGFAIPAGEFVDRTATVWLIPWEEKDWDRGPAPETAQR